MLPESADMNAWAVIACDQHTSDPNYWEELDRLVGEKPSTLRLTLPEIYLSDHVEERTQEIFSNMCAYRERGIFKKMPSGFILVERDTFFSPTRFGIVLAVDLEGYSYEKGAKAAIKATEATILERIPPRLKIREGAPLEFPHVMLLYDDPEDCVLGAWKSSREKLEKVYDFDLNMGGGHIRGYFIPQTERVTDAFASVADKEGTVFMVGDGNHSLATAKTLWEKIKTGLTEEERKDHPARFVLCEAVNLYDKGIRFEAIHRIVKGIKDPQKFLAGFAPVQGGEAALVVGGRKIPFSLGTDVAAAVEYADGYISDYISRFGGEVDYIHGEGEIARLTRENTDCVGILLPKMKKEDLFATVKKHGCLPRKTFSMGESAEKRYYIEGKEILK